MTSMAASSPPTKFLRLLAHSLRWQILTALARSDHRVQDLANLGGKPMNLISYHLGRLRAMKLVRERRSDADGRDVYYSLDLDRLQHIYRAVGHALHPALDMSEPLSRDGVLQDRPAHVLFLCTENSARSQMAEGILRHLSHGQVEVASAGSHPSSVHPLAVQVLAEQGIDISGHRSKSLEEFRGQKFDYIITVCDRIKETCPTFTGDPERIHWSFADPAATGDETRYWAFKVAAKELMTMIRYLLIMIDRDTKQSAHLK